MALSFVQGLFSERNTIITIADVWDNQEMSSIDGPLSWGKIKSTRPETIVMSILMSPAGSGLGEQHRELWH